MLPFGNITFVQLSVPGYFTDPYALLANVAGSSAESEVVRNVPIALMPATAITAPPAIKASFQAVSITCSTSICHASWYC